MKLYQTISRLLMAFLLLGGVISCAGKDKTKPNGPDNPPNGKKVQVFLTKGDKTALFAKQNEIEFIQSVPTGMAVMRIDTGFKFQVVEGYGAALTGSSAWLINRKLTPSARQTLLSELFNPTDGIGVSYLRLTMGASDFSLSDFTYNDLPSGQTDFELQQFSLAQDYDDVIPVLKEILQVVPDIKVLGSPWSPPAWMKTNNNLKRGKLKTACYDVYADYFVRYINAMKQEGISIDAITIQNEPLHFSANYPCMEMQATEQLNFIKSHLGPKFTAAGLKTKIITYDHNWDEPNYPITILNDPAAKQYVAGSAFHAYAGDVSAMSAVHNAHPDKGLYFTEISGGAWATDFAGNLMWNMRNIFIGTARNWSKNALLWNLALDENYGPQNNGCNNCRGVITINSTSGEITRNEEYYAIAHFSKFVRPGAVRVSGNLPQSAGDAGVVAFRNADGTMVLIAANYGNQATSFAVEQDSTIFTVNIPAVSVVTFVW
ncbi:MAG: glucan endo-1,6-beta-glucosidase [Bacteroidetes bacterium HGW-Bacteroidetes-11]|nr:MAG: glucan endo-1,6-beta-glucosidase [Bacteroidetes bacterium HGW-Bacteroidetes-11]